MGKEIVQVRYNPRTSSTKIKETMLEQGNVCAEPY